MRRLWYMAKAQASWGWLVPLAVLGFLLMLLFNDVFRGRYPAPRLIRDTYVIIQVYLSLLAVVLLAPVPSLECENGTSELFLTYRHPAWLRLLSMLITPAAIWAAGVAVSALLIHFWYVPVDAGELLKVTLPPGLALGAAALAGSAVARHQVGGMAAAGLWWGMDLMAAGKMNRWFYLFSPYKPVPGLDPEGLRLNALLLAGACLLLTLWLTEQRERWIRG